MSYQSLLTENRNNILIVTINREKAYNALNKQVFDDLDELFTKEASSQSLKGIVLTGAGSKAFVAGADIKEFSGISPENGKRLAKRGQDVFFKIERFSKPVIAAVNGFALGGGCELSMACHMRIAGEKAKFGQPEVNLGLIPGYGGTQRLTRYIGKAKSIELHLTGDMIVAEEAHRLGLVNYVVPQGEEVAKALEIIEKIATKAPIAVAKAIECINQYYEKCKDGYELEIERFAECTTTEDFIEGTMAFVEKRKADFKGK